MHQRIAMRTVTVCVFRGWTHADTNTHTPWTPGAHYGRATATELEMLFSEKSEN